MTMLRCGFDKDRLCREEQEMSTTPCAFYNEECRWCEIWRVFTVSYFMYFILAGELEPELTTLDDVYECFLDKDYKCCGYSGVHGDAEAICTFCSTWSGNTKICIYQAIQELTPMVLALMVPA